MPNAHLNDHLEDFVHRADQLPAARDTAPAGRRRAAESLEQGGGIDRRTVIRTAGVVGVGIVGAVTVAACGSGNNTASTSGGAGASAGASAGSGKEVIKAADIPVGGGTVFPATKIVVTQPKAGEFKAFSAVCTHMGCTVGGVANDTITCPCHGSTYNAATGQVTGGPAPSPLPPKTVTVKDGTITVS